MQTCLQWPPPSSSRVCGHRRLWCKRGGRTPPPPTPPRWLQKPGADAGRKFAPTYPNIVFKASWKDSGNVAGDWQLQAAAPAVVAGSRVDDAAVQAHQAKKEAAEGGCWCCCALLNKENLIQKTTPHGISTRFEACPINLNTQNHELQI